MVESENQLFCRLNAVTPLAGEQRLKALSELGLLEAQTIPVFEEATQTAAHLLNAPICILGFLDQNRYSFKSAVGLSHLGLMNKLAQERQLPKQESLCAYVVESHQVLAINDALSHPNFANSVLVKRYGIRAYLGVPLFDASGNCLGAIALMHLEPRNFTVQDTQLLEIIARWSMSEFERNVLLKGQDTSTTPPHHHNLVEVKLTAPNSTSAELLSTTEIKLELLAQLTQELRTPLTSIMGMASVVSREIFGPLTHKQKEYIEIIQNSGRYLLSLVNEITELGTLKDISQALNLSSVNIEMLCQQVINILSEAAKRREQEIHLSLEPRLNRVWVLDKEKVRQLLYHLVFSVIQAATNGSIIHIRVSHNNQALKLVVTVSHPWLGQGLTRIEPFLNTLTRPLISTPLQTVNYNNQLPWSESAILPIKATQPLELTVGGNGNLASATSASDLAESDNEDESLNKTSNVWSRECLHLLLSCNLVDLHGGQISIQGTAESGYHYVVSLPELTLTKESF